MEAETMRMVTYQTLVQLAERFGFPADSVGVSISTMQNPFEPGKISLDLSMPSGLREILVERGFLDSSQPIKSV